MVIVSCHPEPISILSFPLHAVAPLVRTSRRRTPRRHSAIRTAARSSQVRRPCSSIYFVILLCSQCKNIYEEFLTRVTENTRMYIGIFADAIDELMSSPTEAFTDDDHDILMTQRSDEGTEGADGSDPRQKMPPEINRFFEVYIKASSKGRPFTIREVTASNIGQLVRIAGIVTRCSDVKPLMQVAIYICEDCGFEIYQEVTARVFMPLFECPSKRCVMNRSKGIVNLQLRASKFLRWFSLYSGSVA